VELIEISCAFEVGTDEGGGRACRLLKALESGATAGSIRKPGEQGQGGGKSACEQGSNLGSRSRMEWFGGHWRRLWRSAFAEPRGSKAAGLS
jgi:hypothetical protein